MTLLSKMLCRPCVFCSIAEGNFPEKILYKDHEMVAFHDINPSAETHILIIPVQHIETVKTVEPSHSDLLRRMRDKAEDLLKENGHDPAMSKMGFHVPPFNTIDHLHLHVLGGEYKSNFRRLKYKTGRMWYMELDDLLINLEKKRALREGSRL